MRPGLPDALAGPALRVRDVADEIALHFALADERPCATTLNLAPYFG